LTKTVKHPSLSNQFKKQNVIQTVNKTVNTSAKSNYWGLIEPLILNLQHYKLYHYTVSQLKDGIYTCRVLSSTHGTEDEFKICEGNSEETRSRSEMRFEMGKAIRY